MAPRNFKLEFLLFLKVTTPEDWHCPAARVDLTVGGGYTYTMAARDAPKAAYAFMQMSKFDIAKLEEAVR